jgi:O-antigen ligase
VHDFATTNQTDNSLIEPGPSRAATVFGLAVGVLLPGIFLGRSVLGAFLVLALVAYFLMRERSVAFSHLKTIKNNYLTLLVGIVLISWIPQLFGAADLWKSAGVIARSGLLVLAAGILWSGLYGNDSILHLALKAFLISAAILLVLTITALLAVPEIYAFIHAKGWILLDVRGGFKAAAASGTLMIPLALWAGWSLSGNWRWIGIAVAFMFLETVLLTYNRAGIGGIVGATIVVMAVILPLLKSRLFIGLTGLIAVAVIAASFVWLYYSRFDLEVPHGSLQIVSNRLIDWHRQEIWSHAWDLGADARWFGTGANGINFLPGADGLIDNTTQKAIPLHPHNWAIEIIVETGIVGFIGLLSAIVISFFRFIGDYWRSRELSLLAIIAVWTVYWSSGLFNFSYWSAWWQVSFYVATAICLAGRHSPEVSQTGQTP